MSEGKEVPAKEFAKVEPSLVDELNAILASVEVASVEDLAEAKKSVDVSKKNPIKKKAKSGGHNPFKHQTKNGPGPDNAYGDGLVPNRREGGRLEVQVLRIHL